MSANHEQIQHYQKLLTYVVYQNIFVVLICMYNLWK